MKSCAKHGEITSGSRCKVCAKERASAWAKANPERKKATAKAYREENKEKVKASTKKWIAENEDKYRATLAAYRAKNINKCKESESKWRAKNKGRLASLAEKWKSENPDKIRASWMKWQNENRDKVRSANNQWRKANSEMFRIYKQNRRSRILNNGGVLSKGIAEKLFKLQRGKCACCGELLGNDYHLDHKMPLALGGSNTDDNMQLLRAICNMQKGAKNPIEFMQSRGFLL